MDFCDAYPKRIRGGNSADRPTAPESIQEMWVDDDTGAVWVAKFETGVGIIWSIASDEYLTSTFANLVHTHDATDVVSGVLDIARIPSHTHSGSQITSVIDRAYYPDMVGATPFLNGSKGAVPQPLAGDNARFLRGDGTWASVSVSAAIESESFSGGRITLSNSDPLPVADIAGASATVLYYLPYISDKIMLYNGSSWEKVTFSSPSISVPAVANTNYDVFCYLSSGTPTLELVAWASNSARATALTRQNGVYVLSGSPTRKYLGTIRTVAASQSADSVIRRFVWNMYNREPRGMAGTAGGSWTYNVANTWRGWNGGASGNIFWVNGLPISGVKITNTFDRSGANTGNVTNQGIGVDSAVAPFSLNAGGAEIAWQGAEGYHFAQGLERQNTSTVLTYFGTVGGVQNGVLGVIHA